MKITSLVLILLFAAGLLVNTSCSSATYSSGDQKMKKIENSGNYSDGKFYNKMSWNEPAFGEWFGMLYDFLFLDNDRKPKIKLPYFDVDFTKFKDTSDNQLNITWIGHSSVMINIDGYRILIDPIFDRKHTLFGPFRYNGPVPLELEDIPAIDLVLITHNHYDHLNRKTIKAIRSRVKQFIVPLGVGAELEGWKVPRTKIIEMDWWDEFNYDDNLFIAFTPTQHFSGRGMFDRNETLWGSFVIKTKNHSVYFSGDSGYFEGFKKIGEKYGPFDITFMECGAYNPKWHHIHMYPEETVQAHLDVKGKLLHPIHWGTFDLAFHSWYDPMLRAAKAADSAGVKLVTPIVGETIVINDHLKTERWWEKFVDKKLIDEKSTTDKILVKEEYNSF